MFVIIGVEEHLDTNMQVCVCECVFSGIEIIFKSVRVCIGMCISGCVGVCVGMFTGSDAIFETPSPTFDFQTTLSLHYVHGNADTVADDDADTDADVRALKKSRSIVSEREIRFQQNGKKCDEMLI